MSSVTFTVDMKRNVDKETRYTAANIKPKSMSTSPSARSQQAIYRSGPLRTMYLEPAPAIQDLCSRQYMAPKPVYSVVLILQLGACRGFMSVNAVDLLSGFQRKLFPIRLFSPNNNERLNHLFLYLFDIAFLRGARFFDICPATNPTLLGLNVVLSLGTKYQYDLPWPSCGPYLQNVDCVADLGFVAPLTTGTVFNPTNTPAAGTQTLFDEPGTVTSPPSGSVFTWFAYESSYSYVVTAMEAETTVATGGVGVSATEGGVTNTGAAGAASTSSGSGSSGGTTKSSAAQSLRLILPARLGLVAVGFSLFL
jgi:hypothetical protein